MKIDTHDSATEEIICALWTIAAVVAFGFGFNLCGWIFGIKAGFDLLLCFAACYREWKAFCFCKKVNHPLTTYIPKD